MRLYFPATDYHTFNLDWLIDKMNELAEYVRTRVTSIIDGTKVYMLKLYPYTDEEGASHIPEFAVQDIGAKGERTANDGDAIRFRINSPELAEADDRGTIAFSGSEMKVKTPHIKIKDGNAKTLDIQGDSSTHKVFVNGGGDFTTVYLGDSSNRVTVTNVAEPVTDTDACTKYYADHTQDDTKAYARDLVVAEQEARIADVDAEENRATLRENAIEAAIPTDYATTTDITNAMDRVVLFRSPTVTSASALSKSEIETLIDEHVHPSSEYMFRTLDQSGAQFIGGVPDTANGMCMEWKLKTTTEDPTNSFGIVGYTPGAFSTEYVEYPMFLSMSQDNLNGWGWKAFRYGVDMTLSLITKKPEGSDLHFLTVDLSGASTNEVRLHGVTTPTSGNDATNKTYVDAHATQLQNQIDALTTALAMERARIDTILALVDNKNT